MLGSPKFISLGFGSALKFELRKKPTHSACEINEMCKTKNANKSIEIGYGANSTHFQHRLRGGKYSPKAKGRFRFKA